MRSIFCAVVMLLLPGVGQAGSWIRDDAAIMGTNIHVELWHESTETGQKLVKQVMDEMRRIDVTMSPFKPESELSRINRLAGSQVVRTTEELVSLIAKSIKVSALTSGAFDVTYASLGRYYDYRKHVRPKSSEIKRLLPAIDYKSIQLNIKAQEIRFGHPETSIDLGGIAKGHAVDRCIALLGRAGVKHAIVTAGGDSRIIGDRFGRPWIMGIRHPRRDRGVVAKIPVVNEAISTSGDYERYFDEGGVRYHHILNPRTGDSAREVQSVTVIGPDATTTDALSTGFFVMGREKAIALANRLKGVEVVIVDREGVVYYSEGFSGPEPAVKVR